MRWSLATVALATAAIGFGLSGAAPDTPKPVTLFHHTEHLAATKKAGHPVEKCDTCHAMDGKGQIIVPASQGHYPCLQSGCHAELFLAAGKPADQVSEKVKSGQQKVCTICHDGVPWPWKKATTKLTRAFEHQIDHHVEMNHYNHAVGASRPDGKIVECRDCHAVNKAGVDKKLGVEFGLAYNAPGHEQCVLCHNAKGPAPHTMQMCGECHHDGSREDHLGKTREHTTVRACDSEGLQVLQRNMPELKIPGGGVKARCFKHETKEHRYKDGKDVQCSACHGVVTEKDKAGEPVFKSLKDMKSKSIIDHDETKQHEKCGAKGCHDDRVGNGAWRPECGFCHPEVSGF